MKKTTILMAMMVLFPSIISAQSFLSEEQELEIKTDKYYWEEGNAFDETMAYHDALNNLTERIISDVVYQTKKRDEVLKELEMKAHTGRIRQEGMVCVVAWIAKDSVFVTTQRPLNPPQEPVVTPPTSTNEKPSVTTPNPSANTNKVDDPVLQELMSCKTYKEVNKVANRRGFVKGDFNTSDGFDRPDLCLIAIFDSNWALVALLDKGSSSRMDLLSGQTIQNPETHYRNKGYTIWYLQRK